MFHYIFSSLIRTLFRIHFRFKFGVEFSTPCNWKISSSMEMRGNRSYPICLFNFSLKCMPAVRKGCNNLYFVFIWKLREFDILSCVMLCFYKLIELIFAFCSKFNFSMFSKVSLLRNLNFFLDYWTRDPRYLPTRRFVWFKGCHSVLSTLVTSASRIAAFYWRW